MGKGGGKQHTPYEQPDSLKSHQKLSIIDLLSEGPIEGPVNGLQGVLLNDTPVNDSNGKSSVNGLTVQWVAGTQQQCVLEGFEDSASEVPVGVEVKKDAPVTRTITSENIDRLRMTFGVYALEQTNPKKGDRTETSVQFLLQVKRNGTWVTEYNVTLRGKTTSETTKSLVIKNLPPRPFDVRMLRLTDDSTTDTVQNRTFWASYTEIIDSRQRYPNSAVVGMTFDSSQYGSQVPRRNFLIKGRIVQVPSNYDPATRKYDGVWDGAFKPAWTDNPAWVLWDILTHPRYGMGQQLGVDDVDKWMLYVMAQYADSPVPDGQGGTEPRMTFNGWLSEQRRVYDVLADICSTLRCMPVYNGRRMTFVQDRPADKVWTYTNSNVVRQENGDCFTYTFSPKKSRYNVAQVRFTDPDNGWKISTEYVSDDAAIARDGEVVAKVEAFGCTSRGQARRLGKYIVVTAQLERQTVAFSVAAEGLRHIPGDIFQIEDNDYSGASVGGRLLQVLPDDKAVVLDRMVELPEGTSFLCLTAPDGSQNRCSIFSQPEPDRLVLDSLPPSVCAGGTWGLVLPDLSPRLFRCTSIKDKGDGTYDITAVQHVPGKERIVDNGATYAPAPDTRYGGGLPPVGHLVLAAIPDSDAFQVQAHWTVPRVVSGLRFSLKLSRGERAVSHAITEDTTFRFGGLSLGHYTLTVCAVNQAGLRGTPVDTTFSIEPPAIPDRVDVTPGNFSVMLHPVSLRATSLGTQYEFFKGGSEDEAKALSNYLGRATYLNDADCKPDTDYWYAVRTVNVTGKSPPLIVKAHTTLDPDDILDLVGDGIGDLDWVKDLKKQVKDNTAGIVLLNDKAALVVNKDGRISGITVDSSGKKSVVDILADYFCVSDPDTLERRFYYDADRRILVLQGELQLLDGTTISGADDVKNGSGGVFRLQTKDGIFPTDGNAATSLFKSSFGLSPGKDTVFTVYAIDAVGKITHVESRMYDGSDWIVPKLLVDGDIIAMGTIKGDRIVAGAELSAPVIHAGTITSSGNPPAFSLTPDGKLTAKNADISGNINAIGGHFSHVTIDNSCDIQGTLRAEHIVGDIVKAAGGTFPVIRNDYASGTLTVTINDDQSFDRQIIVPPLVFAAGGDAQNMQVASGPITSPTKGASSFSRCHLRVTHNGQEIYNVTVTGNGVGIFSTVLDMPSGRGDAVLQFTVESSHSNGYTPFTSISNLIVMAVRKVPAGISIR